jgi:GT2 family glycosyltransferase
MIVLNYNGRDVLGPCLESMVAAAGPDDEIIIVDNASPDGSADLVPDEPGIRLIRRTVNNFIFGLNDGVAVARGRYVGFFNNDIVVERDFVERCLRHFDGSDVFAVCPRILEKSGRDQGALTSGLYWRGIWYYKVHEHDPTAKETFFAVGGQSFFDADKLRSVGSIDPLLRPMYHEDIELSLRARSAGYEIRFAPDAVVHHVGGHASSRRFSRHELRSFVRQNEFLTAWKLLSARELARTHLPYLPLRLAIATWRRDWATWAGFVRALTRVRELRASRQAARFVRKVGLRELRHGVTPSALAISSQQVG